MENTSQAVSSVTEKKRRFKLRLCLWCIAVATLLVILLLAGAAVDSAPSISLNSPASFPVDI